MNKFALDLMNKVVIANKILCYTKKFWLQIQIKIKIKKMNQILFYLLTSVFSINI